MASLRTEIDETSLERRIGAVPRIAPHLTISALRLLIGRSEQRAVVLRRQCLPMQVEGARQARLA
jgi:hypothetical protein